MNNYRNLHSGTLFSGQHCKNFRRRFDDKSIMATFLLQSSEPLDDNAVTHVMCVGNLNLLDDSVVTYDERVVN